MIRRGDVATYTVVTYQPDGTPFTIEIARYDLEVIPEEPATSGSGQILWEIPQDMLDKAREIDMWMRLKGCAQFQLGPIESRAWSGKELAALRKENARLRASRNTWRATSKTINRAFNEQTLAHAAEMDELKAKCLTQPLVGEIEPELSVEEQLDQWGMEVSEDGYYRPASSDPRDPYLCPCPYCEDTRERNRGRKDPHWLLDFRKRHGEMVMFLGMFLEGTALTIGVIQKNHYLSASGLISFIIVKYWHAKLPLK